MGKRKNFAYLGAVSEKKMCRPVAKRAPWKGWGRQDRWESTANTMAGPNRATSLVGNRSSPPSLADEALEDAHPPPVIRRIFLEFLQLSTWVNREIRRVISHWLFLTCSALRRKLDDVVPKEVQDNLITKQYTKWLGRKSRIFLMNFRCAKCLNRYLNQTTSTNLGLFIIWWLFSSLIHYRSICRISIPLPINKAQQFPVISLTTSTARQS